jgi:hypothetical protein
MSQVRRVQISAPPSPHPGSNDAEDDLLWALTVHRYEPVTEATGLRVLGWFCVGSGVLLLVIGLLLVFAGSSQTTIDNSDFSGLTTGLSSFAGLASASYGIGTLVIGAVLLSLADIRVDTARNARLLAAILEVQLRQLEKP